MRMRNPYAGILLPGFMKKKINKYNGKVTMFLNLKRE